MTKEMELLVLEWAKKAMKHNCPSRYEMSEFGDCGDVALVGTCEKCWKRAFELDIEEMGAYEEALR